MKVYAITIYATDEGQFGTEIDFSLLKAIGVGDDGLQKVKKKTDELMSSVLSEAGLLEEVERISEVQHE